VIPTKHGSRIERTNERRHVETAVGSRHSVESPSMGMWCHFFCRRLRAEAVPPPVMSNRRSHDLLLAYLPHHDRYVLPPCPASS